MRYHGVLVLYSKIEFSVVQVKFGVGLFGQSRATCSGGRVKFRRGEVWCTVIMAMSSVV